MRHMGARLWSTENQAPEDSSVGAGSPGTTERALCLDLSGERACLLRREAHLGELVSKLNLPEREKQAQVLRAITSLVVSVP